jgi:hypothetical protein
LGTFGAVENEWLNTWPIYYLPEHNATEKFGMFSFRITERKTGRKIKRG